MRQTCFNWPSAKASTSSSPTSTTRRSPGKIPDWYRKTVIARTFVLLPLLIKGNAVALIYCDRDKPGSIVIPEKELSLLKTLRNQALLAIKQSM
jgi:hypothetical protein